MASPLLLGSAAATVAEPRTRGDPKRLWKASLAISSVVASVAGCELSTTRPSNSLPDVIFNVGRAGDSVATASDAFTPAVETGSGLQPFGDAKATFDLRTDNRGNVGSVSQALKLLFTKAPMRTLTVRVYALTAAQTNAPFETYVYTSAQIDEVRVSGLGGAIVFGANEYSWTVVGDMATFMDTAPAM